LSVAGWQHSAFARFCLIFRKNSLITRVCVQLPTVLSETRYQEGAAATEKEHGVQPCVKGTEVFSGFNIGENWYEIHLDSGWADECVSWM
jgi:hypothetical protein